MSGVHTNRHHTALCLCVKALGKGRFGSSLGVDGCSNERLLNSAIQVPENISRSLPDWVLPNGAGSPARHQSRPDAVFLCALFQADELTLILPRSLLRTGTSTLLN
eukprot:901025-Pelagomonas_calceolata.AAC.1